MSTKVRSAIFPVAGLGTRFLPATKATPKELLPVIDTPLIQYAIDEAPHAFAPSYAHAANRSWLTRCRRPPYVRFPMTSCLRHRQNNWVLAMPSCAQGSMCCRAPWQLSCQTT